MDFKKSKAPTNTITWDTAKLSEPTGNVYESIMIVAKRANQISVDMKEELNRKLQEFASYTDNLEEVFENREQIEISRFYERLPKASALAVTEFMEDNVYFRNPGKEENPDVL
ncbi:DNA-directed RNA polymerase subunit omega [Geofilum rhodophaeum]|uniref:DNA-directed RNA polymerase subunit omega n=1 Tax=Geofilum rhodophaeum TaxID=1965019 RepID=UPI000B527CC8|nr:DNA-directed RNA polymerase subunit omega [Geofilum rhodophaeum]